MVNFCSLLVISVFSKITVKILLGVSFLLWLLIGILKYREKKDKSWFIKPSCLNKPLLFLFGVYLFSVIFSLDFLHSQEIFFARHIPYLLLFLLGSYFSTRTKSLKILIGFFLFGGAVISGGGVWDYLRRDSDRLLTLFGWQFNIAPYMVLYVCTALPVLVWCKNKLLRLFGVLSFIVSYLCLIWNAARSAWLAVFVAVLAVFLLKSKKIAIGFLVFIALTYLFMSPYYRVRVDTMFETSKWGDRVELFKTAVRIFKKYPVFGSGLGMYEKLLYKYGPVNGYPEGNWHLHAHNVYLELVSEIGSVGLLAFLIVFGVFFSSLFRKNTRWRTYAPDIQGIFLGLTCSIFASLILGFGSSIIIIGIQDAAVFWFFLGIAAGLTANLKEHPRFS